jgi:hypothetical protein
VCCCVDFNSNSKSSQALSLVHAAVPCPDFLPASLKSVVSPEASGAYVGLLRSVRSLSHIDLIFAERRFLTAGSQMYSAIK